MRLMTKKEMKQDLKEVNKRKKFREALLQLVKNRSMSKPEIKTVYVPATVIDRLDHDYLGYAKKIVFPEQLITFTPEEYNKHIQKVIDDALKTAAENADITYTQEKTFDFTDVDKQSITNTFDETFKKFKV